MKKVLALTVFLGIVFFVNQAFAQSFTTAKENTDGSWTETSNFSHTEKPWLHISVPDVFTSDVTMSYWNYPAPGSSYYLSDFFFYNYELKKDGSNLYLSFDDTTWFGNNSLSGLVKGGDWEISAATVLLKQQDNQWNWPSLQAYSGNAKFTVSPEPVSCVLFLLGGGAFVGARRLRKK